MHFLCILLLVEFKISRHTSGVVNVFCFSSATYLAYWMQYRQRLAQQWGGCVNFLRFNIQLNKLCICRPSFLPCASNQFSRAPTSMTTSALPGQTNAQLPQKVDAYLPGSFRHRHWQEWNLGTFNKFTKLSSACEYAAPLPRITNGRSALLKAKLR